MKRAKGERLTFFPLPNFSPMLIFFFFFFDISSWGKGEVEKKKRIFFFFLPTNPPLFLPKKEKKRMRKRSVNGEGKYESFFFLHMPPHRFLHFLLVFFDEFEGSESQGSCYTPFTPSKPWGPYP